MDNGSKTEKNRTLTEIEERLKDLPKGYISRKMIGGKERLYLQWRDGAKVRSRYIKASERDALLSQLEEKKLLEKERDALVAEEAFVYEEKPVLYLKWEDEVVGLIDAGYNVRFINKDLNRPVRETAPKSGYWSRNEFKAFLEERVISAGRRDIEEILFKLGLTKYDAVEIAKKTHAISARDLFWITDKKEEKFSDAVTEVFDSVFLRGEDLEGDSVDTPEGQNVKRYGVSRGRYGIYKKRLSPVSTDLESELAVCALADKLGVSCCQCWRVDEDTLFSAFEYDFASEYIVHFRHLISERESQDELENLISARPAYLQDIAKMTALDFVTRQDDRHLSNIAVKIKGDSEEFYPLYDNGRSLFYEDTSETASKACSDIERFATSFGPSGSYLDHVRKLSDMGISFGKIMDLGIREEDVERLLIESGFSTYRLDAAREWIMKTLGVLRELG